MEDLHKYWNHRWVTPKAYPKKSPTHGKGVFAKEDIVKGEIVCVFGGVVVQLHDHGKYFDKMDLLGIQVDDNFFMCPSSKEEYHQGIFNHSCEPNCGFRDSVVLIAMRNIKKGEELFMDYGFFCTVTRSFDCNSGKPNCRKQISGQDWTIQELRDKYFDYFSPYIKEKIMKDEL